MFARSLGGLVALGLVMGCTALKEAQSADPPPADGGSDSADETPSAGEDASREDAGDASALPADSRPPDTGPADGGAPIEVNLTTAGACSPQWANLALHAPPQTPGSLSVINTVTLERITLIRRSQKSTLILSSDAHKADDDTLQILSNGQLFYNQCNVSVTGGCAYIPSTQKYVNDTIEGTVHITTYDLVAGAMDIEFVGVVLQSATTADLCRVSGTVRARR